MRTLPSRVLLWAATLAVALTAVLVVMPSPTRGDRLSPDIDLGPVAGFVENLGQWPQPVAFAAAASGQWVQAGAQGVQFGRGALHIEVRPSGSAPTAPRGHSPTGGVCNFLRGADTQQHVRGARIFAAVEQPEIAPGVDLLLRRAAPGRAAVFAYDIQLAPHAQLDDIEFVVLGATTMHVDAATGELVMTVGDDEVRHSRPIAWQRDGERRLPIECDFVLRGADRYGFRAAAVDASLALCLDPDLRWATCFGGSLVDNGNAVAVAANGDVFVAGTTRSTTLPGTAGAFDPTFNGEIAIPQVVGDGYLARLAGSNGALLWCTFLGGPENDHIQAVGAVGDEPVVTGWTSSPTFPTTALAFDPIYNGTGDGVTYLGGDVFVARLAANGQTLVWSTFLGGAQLEYPTSMAIAANGEVAVSGHVHSLNFPTTPGAFSSTRLAFSDFFVTHLAANGASLIGSTYCGGTDGEEYPYAMAFAADGDLIAAGATDSSNLPVTVGSYDPTFNGGSEHFADAFVVRFSPTCSVLRWCTYLGTPSNEYARGLAMHADGSMTVTGSIDGPGLPTTPAVFGPTPFGARDGFVWRLAGNGATSVWATYVGGAADDRLERALALGGGRTAVAGLSASANMPLSRGSAFALAQGQTDGWLGIVSSDGTAIDYGSAIGAQFSDFGIDVARTANGDLVTTGTTYSGSFPVTAGGLPNVGGGDAYVVRVAGLPNGVVRHGAPSGACGSAARIYARSGPFVGEASFALTAGDVPLASPALAVIAGTTLASPLSLLGIDVWVDVAGLITTLTVPVDSYGSARLPIPIPANAGLAGAALAVQFVWLAACPNLAFNASDAVAIVVQP